MSQNETNDEEESTKVDFTFSSQAPELTQEILPVRATELSNLKNLNHEAREKVLQDLLRLILFKALAGEPIDRTKVIKEAGISDARISSAAFDEVNTRLQAIFDFKLVRVPSWMEKIKDLPKKFKDRYYVINQAEDTSGCHSRALHSSCRMGAVGRGFLMVVLGFIFCKGVPRSDGSRWLLDKDLFELLHKVDENIPADPPIPGTRRKKSNKTEQDFPDIDLLLPHYVHMDYLLEVKASQNEQVAAMNAKAEADSMFYALGPRAVMEIGRQQIVFFCAESLDENVDQSMLDEIHDDEDPN